MQRFLALVFTIAGALSAAIPAAYPVSAQAATRGDCSSNQNISEVYRHLKGTISQLNHDDRDYGGHRQSAVNDLEAARVQLEAARDWAVNDDHENPACFRAFGPAGGDNNASLRGQPGSNRNIWGVRRRVESMIDQLQRDQRDYGGRRETAIDNLQKARTELLAAERDASSHGY